MTAGQVFLLLVVYFSILVFISYITGKGAKNQTFFIGNRKSPWYVVSFGMIGASISGVTFISVPGWVGTSQFSYLQMVLGYLFGYLFIAQVLLPLYYRLQLTSIYTYLEQRFGTVSHKTGASFFLVSRMLGSSLRLYLVANVLQLAVFNAWGIPFWTTVAFTIFLIWLYTFKGGVRTIIWTDSLQTFFMLSALILTIIFIAKELNMSFGGMVQSIQQSPLSRIWFFDNPTGKTFFVKQFLSGAFITIVMTGLDQDMMQKNLSCKNLREAKKNVYWYGASFLPVNLLFLSLGVLLYLFATSHNIQIPQKTDDLYPMLATQGYLPITVSLLFILGLIAAAYSSADSALTALTTSFSIDILGIQKMQIEEKKQILIRKWVHVGMSVLTGIVILVFNKINNQAVIGAVFTLAGYTYGPLLGLFAFGMFTPFTVRDRWVWLVAILSPILCLFLGKFSSMLFWGYEIGFEMLIYNGLFTFLGLILIRQTKKKS